MCARWPGHNLKLRCSPQAELPARQLLEVSPRPVPRAAGNRSLDVPPENQRIAPGENAPMLFFSTSFCNSSIILPSAIPFNFCVRAGVWRGHRYSSRRTATSDQPSWSFNSAISLSRCSASLSSPHQPFCSQSSASAFAKRAIFSTVSSFPICSHSDCLCFYKSRRGRSDSTLSNARSSSIPGLISHRVFSQMGVNGTAKNSVLRVGKCSKDWGLR